MDGIAFFTLRSDRTCYEIDGAKEREVGTGEEGGQGVFPSVAEWLSISFWVTAALSRVLERFSRLDFDRWTWFTAAK